MEPFDGTYRHTYAGVPTAHDELILAVTGRVTVLYLGGSLDEQAHAPYLDLADSTVPLGEDDPESLGPQAAWCANTPQPEAIPVREIRAGIFPAKLACRRNSGITGPWAYPARTGSAGSGAAVTSRTPGPAGGRMWPASLR